MDTSSRIAAPCDTGIRNETGWGRAVCALGLVLAEELHQGLMRSPGHRSAILDPKATRVGVGIAVPPAGQRYRVVGTELFR